MPTVVISIPDPLQAWLDDQTRDGQFASTSEYVRTLIEKERDRTAAIVEIQSLINEGLASGISDRSPEEVFRMARERATSRRS